MLLESFLDGHEAFLWICVDRLSTVNSESEFMLTFSLTCNRVVKKVEVQRGSDKNLNLY